MPARARPAPLADPMADLSNLLGAMHPAELEAFTGLCDPADVALVEQVLAERTGRGWRTDPATFAHHLDRTYKQWRYVRLLSDQFRRAVSGEAKRQIWNLPARYGKSLLGSQWGPVWCIDHTGGRARIILWSYGKQLAVENAVGIRDRLTEHQALLADGCQLAPGRRRMDRFTTVAGGGVLAAGVSGAVRGFGAGQGGGIVADDPFKDWQEAHSEHRRELVWNQYRGTLLDRLDDESAWIIVVHHRVHEDDLTGRLLAEAAAGTGDEWESVVLPAIAPVPGPDDPPDPLGRTPGEALEPERFSVPFIHDLMRGMGSYLASGLQLQRPTPEEGTDLRRGWFKLYAATEAEAGAADGMPLLPAHPDQTLTSWDLKLKDTQQGDWVVGQAWWRVGADYYLVGQLRGLWDHATTANAVALLGVRHPECTTHVVEQAAAYTEVTGMLRKPRPDYVVTPEMAALLGMSSAERDAVQAIRRRGMVGLVGHPPMNDKTVRARLYVAPAAEAGNVWLPGYHELTPLLLDELAAFPNATHDDQVDAMSQALQRMGTGTATVAAAEGRLPPRPTPTPTGRPRATGPLPSSAVGVPARVATSAPNGRLGRPRAR